MRAVEGPEDLRVIGAAQLWETPPRFARASVFAAMLACAETDRLIPGRSYPF